MVSICNFNILRSSPILAGSRNKGEMQTETLLFFFGIDCRMQRISDKTTHDAHCIKLLANPHLSQDVNFGIDQVCHLGEMCQQM